MYVYERDKWREIGSEKDAGFDDAPHSFIPVTVTGVLKLPATLHWGDWL